MCFRTFWSFMLGTRVEVSGSGRARGGLAQRQQRDDQVFLITQMLRQQRTANRQRPRHVVRALPRGGFGRAGVRELRAQALQVAHRCVDALVVGRQQVKAFVQARLGAAQAGK